MVFTSCHEPVSWHRFPRRNQHYQKNLKSNNIGSVLYTDHENILTSISITFKWFLIVVQSWSKGIIETKSKGTSTLSASILSFLAASGRKISIAVKLFKYFWLVSYHLNFKNLHLKGSVVQMVIQGKMSVSFLLNLTSFRVGILIYLDILSWTCIENDIYRSIKRIRELYLKYSWN